MRSVIFVNLLLLLILPPLNNAHYEPLAQFFAESVAAWLALSLFALTIFTIIIKKPQTILATQIAIPPIALAILCLAVALLAQKFFVPLQFYGYNVTIALALCLTALVIIASYNLILLYKANDVLLWLSGALVIGACLQSIIGFLQFNNIAPYLSPFIFYDANHPTTNIFGHFGQRNHYANYLSMGVFSLIYLRCRAKISFSIFLFLLLWLLLAITISSSRSVFLYFLLANLISLIYVIFNKKDHNNSKAVNNGKAVKHYCMLVSGATLVLLFVEYCYPWYITHLHGVVINSAHIHSGLERLLAGDSEMHTSTINNAQHASHTGGIIGRRWIEWQKAFMVFRAHIYSGVGLGQFALQSFSLNHIFAHVPANDGLFTNCHNILLQFMAETGLVGSLLLIISVGYGLYQLVTLQNKLGALLLLSLSGTILTHSMVEYPLWYLYFTIPLAICFSFRESNTNTNTNTNTNASAKQHLIALNMAHWQSRLIVGAATLFIVILFGYLLITANITYNYIQQSYTPPNKQAAFMQNVKHLEQIYQHNLLLSFAALNALDNYIVVNDSNKSSIHNNIYDYSNGSFTKAQQLFYETQFIYYRPYPENIIKLAMLKCASANTQHDKYNAAMSLDFTISPIDAIVTTRFINKKATISQAQMLVYYAQNAYPTYYHTFLDMLNTNTLYQQKCRLVTTLMASSHNS